MVEFAQASLGDMKELIGAYSGAGRQRLVVEVSAYHLASTKQIILRHGTSKDLVGGFENQLVKTFDMEICEALNHRLPLYSEAEFDADPRVINLRSPGHVLAQIVTSNPVEQLTIASSYDERWLVVAQGATSLLRRTNFYHP